MRISYDVCLEICGHYEKVMMSISTAQYRRNNWEHLPLMQIKCTECSKVHKGYRYVMRNVVRIETNERERLYLAKAMKAIVAVDPIEEDYSEVPF